MEVLRVSELFSPTHGDKKGTCVVCGFETEKGHKIDFSGNFTAWNELQEGNVICEYCYTLVREQQYRRKSWVANKEGVRFLQKDEILDTLMNPPQPPFAIYLTKSGKKQGFLKLINRVAYSKKQYFTAFEDSLIFVEQDVLREMVDVARKARKLKFSKTELLEGPKTHNWIYDDLCKQIERFRKNPLWEVVVYAVK
ncbi:hypothetical protein ACO3UB_08340 (plasmid) [Methanocaldococcus sp. 16A]